MSRFLKLWNIQTLRVVLLEPVILLYMTSIWMQFNLFQPLLFRKVCLTYYRNETFCAFLTQNHAGYEKEADRVQEHSSRLLFYSNLCLSIPSILLCPFLGIWGDRFGRKVASVVPAVGALLSAVNYAVCAAVPTAKVEMLLLSNLFQGLTGGFTGCILAVSSWASHISSHKKRTSRLGFIEFANLVGTSVAPAIGGVVARDSGYTAAFAIAGSLNIFLILYVIFFLREPEGLPTVKSGMSGALRGIWSIEFLRDMVSLVRWIYQDTRARTCFLIATICLSVTWTVSTGTNEIRYLFIRTLNLDWDVLEYNLFAAEDAFVRGITLATILPALKHYYRLRDFVIITYAFASKLLMFVVFAVSFNTVMIFLAPFAGFLSAAVSACGRSSCSKIVDSADQGKLFGLLAVLENLSSLVGSLLFQNVYLASRGWFPGFAYALAGAILCIPATIILVFFRQLKECDLQSEIDQSALIVEEDFVDDPDVSSLTDLDLELPRTVSLTV